MSVSVPPPSRIDEDTLLRGEHGVIAEPDRANTRLVALVGAVAVAIFIVAGFWATWLYFEARKTFAPDGVPEIPELLLERPYEIGIVNQWDFAVDRRAYVLGAQRETQLNAFGWVDRPAERIHVPVESAYADVIANRGVSPVAPAAPAPETSPEDTEVTPDAPADTEAPVPGSPEE